MLKKKEPEAQVDIFFNQLHMCLHLSHLIRYKNKDLLCFHFKKKIIHIDFIKISEEDLGSFPNQNY